MRGAANNGRQTCNLRTEGKEHEVKNTRKESGKGKRKRERARAIENLISRRDVGRSALVMERRGDARRGYRWKERIKANRHKAIDRGRSSRSLMAWKNSEDRLTLRYGTRRCRLPVAAASPIHVATNREHNGLYISYIRGILGFSIGLLGACQLHPFATCSPPSSPLYLSFPR